MFHFRLFVAGDTGLGRKALEDFDTHIRAAIPGDVELEVIDVSKEPEMAIKFRVLATPTLLRSVPPPHLRIVGDFTDSRVLQEVVAGGNAV